MKFQKQFALTGLAIFLTFPTVIHAQTSRKSPTPLRAIVGDVTDTRTTTSFNSECKVELKFTGDAASDAGAVRQVRLTEATDETGRDLILKNDDVTSSHSFNSGRSGTPTAEVRLRNPSRNASCIKTLKGEVEMFKATEANGGLLVLKDVLLHPAEPIENPALAKYGIQLMYLTKDTYEAKKKEMEAKKTEGGSTGLGEIFGDAFRGMFSGMMSTSKNSIQLYVKDPQDCIVDIKFQDSKGKVLKTNQSWSSGSFRNTGLEAPPPADAQLLIQIATPESLKSYPIELHDIPLP